MPQTADSGFDSIVLDKEDHPIAVILVRDQPIRPERMNFLPTQLQNFGQPVPFLILVEPTRIDLYQWDGSTLTGPVVQLNAADVLHHYEPEYEQRRIFRGYLRTLVEGWLRDQAYHWKSENPPAAEELRRVGFLGKLEGGTAVPLGG